MAQTCNWYSIGRLICYVAKVETCFFPIYFQLLSQA
jgi:hypothetical protein